MKNRSTITTGLRQQGFTLVEILVVAAVIVVLASMVSFAIPRTDPDSQLRHHAERFHKQIVYLSEQAVLKGEIYAMFVDQDLQENAMGLATPVWCFEWQRVRDSQWQPVPELNGRECLDPGVVLDVRLNGKKWEYSPKQDTIEPVLGFFPSGDATGDVEMAFKVDQQAMGNQLVGLPANNANQNNEETFWVSMLGEIHWLSEELRMGIETRVDLNRQWFR